SGCECLRDPAQCCEKSGSWLRSSYRGPGHRLCSVLHITPTLLTPLRIPPVAPLFESVPPRLYGGTERVVSYLTEALVRQGHDVTLFASGDSATSARLVAPCRKSLRLSKESVETLAPHVLMQEMVLQRADDFDVVHYHV